MLPDKLTDGYRSFLDGRLARERREYDLLGREGQKPQILLISCCDSRVAPEVIFDVGPGELFVVRNVASIVPPFEEGGKYHGTSSALEFAVQALQVAHIVVLGHASCGGIKAYATSALPLSPGNFIGQWVSLVAPAAEKLKERSVATDTSDYLTRLECAMVEQSLDNLMTFDFVRERVESGQLKLHGAHFGIATGELRILDPETHAFEPLVKAGEVPLSPSSMIGCTDA